MRSCKIVIFAYSVSLLGMALVPAAYSAEPTCDAQLEDPVLARLTVKAKKFEETPGRSPHVFKADLIDGQTAWVENNRDGLFVYYRGNWQHVASGLFVTPQVIRTRKTDLLIAGERSRFVVFNFSNGKKRWFSSAQEYMDTWNLPILTRANLGSVLFIEAFSFGQKELFDEISQNLTEKRGALFVQDNDHLTYVFSYRGGLDRSSTILAKVDRPSTYPKRLTQTELPHSEGLASFHNWTFANVTRNLGLVKISNAKLGPRIIGVDLENFKMAYNIKCDADAPVVPIARGAQVQTGSNSWAPLHSGHTRSVDPALRKRKSGPRYEIREI